LKEVALGSSLVYDFRVFLLGKVVAHQKPVKADRLFWVLRNHLWDSQASQYRQILKFLLSIAFLAYHDCLELWPVRTVELSGICEVYNCKVAVSVSAP
jgi:hypothetical protein